MSSLRLNIKVCGTYLTIFRRPGVPGGLLPVFKDDALRMGSVFSDQDKSCLSVSRQSVTSRDTVLSLGDSLLPLAKPFLFSCGESMKARSLDVKTGADEDLCSFSRLSILVTFTVDAELVGNAIDRKEKFAGDPENDGIGHFQLSI